MIFSLLYSFDKLAREWILLKNTQLPAKTKPCYNNSFVGTSKGECYSDSMSTSATSVKVTDAAQTTLTSGSAWANGEAHTLKCKQDTINMGWSNNVRVVSKFSCKTCYTLTFYKSDNIHIIAYNIV